MEVSPPYLFGTVDDDHRESFTLINDVEAAVVEMVVHGRWSQRLGVEVSLGVRKCLAEHPSAILIDLHDLSDQDGSSVAMWLAARRAGAALQPPVQLALCIPPITVLARRLRRLGAQQYLLMYTTMPDARTEMHQHLPLTSRLQLSLPADLHSASAARNLVGEACQSWRLAPLLHRARLVLSELVVNAVEHARTDILVTVSRRDSGLHLSVRDGDPRAPRLRQPARVVSGAPLDERGQGLHLVHIAATTWGCMPTRNGKVVWASVRPRHGETPRR